MFPTGKRAGLTDGRLYSPFSFSRLNPTAQLIETRKILGRMQVSDQNPRIGRNPRKCCDEALAPPKFVAHAMLFFRERVP